MTSALADIRVVDLSSGVAGPMATMLLADFGADVVKIEPPGGDSARVLPGFAVWNRNKRSVVLDQRDPRAAPGWPSFCPEPTCAWSASPAARLPVVNSIPTRCAPSIRV